MYLEILNNIYELMQNRILPTKKRLNEIGTTDEQLLYLLENRLIHEVEPGIYKIASVNDIFQYGMSNLLQGNKRTAQECFELCYRIKPRHRDTCLQLFYNAVNNHNYNAAYEYLYALENVSTNEHLRKDYKIYLFLLSQVSEVPEIYQQKLEDIQNNIFLILHKKPNYHQKQDNEIVRLILKGKYKFAIEKLNDFLSEDYNYTVHRLIIKSLLGHIITKNEKYKLELLEKIKKKRYREVLNTLEEISLTRELRSDEFNILELTRTIINIFETGEVPNIIENDASTITEAIQYYDYPKALELEIAFLTSKNYSSDQSPIYILLTEINKIISSINRLKENDIPIGLPQQNAFLQG